MNLKKLLLIDLIIVIVVIVCIASTWYGLKEYKAYKIQQEQDRLNALYTQILDGASTKPINISIDYTKQISIGSPLIFGGVHYPDLSHQDAWNQIEDVGVTNTRIDLAINYMLRDTTLTKYKNNTNNIQDINNWNKQVLEEVRLRFAEVKKRGMKTMGILDYNPAWLTYDGTEYGVPKDWQVYEDIVKKVYTKYRNYLDYIEIWNEPNYGQFLTLGNSGMSREDAYQQIFYHAAKAIREVDDNARDGKKIPIGGPAGDTPTDTSMLETLLQNNDTRNMINFISYHNYNTGEPSWNDYKNVLAKYGMQNYPIFLTEWNYDGKENLNSPNKTSYPAILFTANKLLDFLKMGLTGANYYSLLPIEDASSTNKAEYLGFYKWNNNKAELLPQARTWMLLSKDLGLGSGKSKIYAPLESDSEFNSAGFENALGEQGVAVINSSDFTKNVNLHFGNFGKKNYVKVVIYFASEGNDAKIPIYEGTLQTRNNKLDFLLSIPQRTVIGVIFSEEKDWYNLPLIQINKVL